MQRADHSTQTERISGESGLDASAESVPDDRYVHVCELRKALELLKLVKSTISDLPGQGRGFLETLAAKMQSAGYSEDPVDAIEIVGSVSLEGVFFCLWDRQNL
jgi:hypothetical protein